jgi:hypothetical protein
VQTLATPFRASKSSFLVDWLDLENNVLKALALSNIYALANSIRQYRLTCHEIMD